MSTAQSPPIVETTASSKVVQGSRAKNKTWKAKAMAPGAWVSTLLHGKADGTSILLEFRCGSKGAEMLVDAFPFDPLQGVPVHAAVVPLAEQAWETAQLHRAELDGDRYHYRIKIVSSSDDGAYHGIIESPWVELAEGEADTLAMPEGMGATPTEMMLSGMVIKLFSANIQLTRASGMLVREQSAGATERLNSEFMAVDKIKTMALDLIQQQAEMAKAEGDTEEIKEFGKTARKWMEMGQEEKLAKQGVKSPDVPKTRKSAAISLWKSLTVAQLDAIKAELGEEKSELLIGLVKNAGSMEDDEIALVFEQQLDAGIVNQIEIMGVVGKVFATDFVPSTWAIWQSRTFSVLVDGPDA
jgi:hypothetical protein